LIRGDFGTKLTQSSEYATQITLIQLVMADLELLNLELTFRRS
jgi:hypothetical protein